MQRWFFLEDPENARLRSGKGDNANIEGSDAGLIKYKDWHFRVHVEDLLPGEIVCITGSEEALGNWIPENCVPMKCEENGDNWFKVISIRDVDFEYRYFVCMLVDSNDQIIVRKWETNLLPRKIKQDTIQDDVSVEIFGEYDEVFKVGSGWLTKESVVQFKLFNNPLTLWRTRYAKRLVYIKVTPVNLTRHFTDRPATMAEALEESLSTDNQDVVEPPQYAHTVVACLTAGNSIFEPQGQFGKEYNQNDILIFETSVLDIKNIAFLIDLYVYSSGSTNDDPPYHVGFSYLLPSALKTSEGHTVLPVTSVKHQPMGQIELDYLVIKPLQSFKCDMHLTYARHWKKTRAALDVGHRGLGTSFKIEMKNCAEVRENTIASLKTAASHGADFVEFDVQLSKDLVPVIYHDFHVCISMKRKNTLTDDDMLELPVKELTLEQLHFLKVYHLSEGKTRNPRFFDEDLEEHQPFPTLQQALEVLDPHVGFNIEIKWSNQLQDGTQELEHSIDINIFLDTILDVALKYAGTRRIIFSCFNADICRMIRLKQNIYPVMFLTQGQTVRYPMYYDPRCQTIYAAVQFAVCSDILGVNVHTEDILRDETQVRLATDAGLIIFCWGDDNNNPTTIKHLKDLGLHAVIYDKINEYSRKEVKESIFLVEARESQKELILLAAANVETASQTVLSERSIDVEKARQSLVDMSTVTSLVSLESNDLNKDHCALPNTK